MNASNGFNGPLRYNENNPRYFCDGTKRGVYLTGSHTWAVMQDMWLETDPRKNTDYEGFIQMMEDNGHNFMRFWLYSHVKNAPWNSVSTFFDPMPYERTGPGTARDGLPKFDLTKWNEAYFLRLRERIKKAGEKGIYAAIVFFEAWAIRYCTPDTDPWPYYPMHPDNNVNDITDNPVNEDGKAVNYFSLTCAQLVYWQKEFIKKVIDTVNDLDNVLYEICNEMPYGDQAMKWQMHLCRFVKEYERDMQNQHPVGITPVGGDQVNNEMFKTNADWISLGNGNMFEYRYNPPAADGRKVVVNDTDHLWGHGGEISWVWKSFTRGMNVLFMDPWEPLHSDPGKWRSRGDVPMNSRYYYKWDPIRRNLGYTRKFAVRMDMNKCVPHNELCTSAYCLANPGSEYLCFIPEGGEAGVDLSASDEAFEIELFYPDSGKTVFGEKINGGKGALISSQVEGPFVAYLHKNSEKVIK